MSIAATVSEATGTEMLPEGATFLAPRCLCQSASPAFIACFSDEALSRPPGPSGSSTRFSPGAHDPEVPSMLSTSGLSRPESSARRSVALSAWSMSPSSFFPSADATGHLGLLVVGEVATGVAGTVDDGEGGVPLALQAFSQVHGGPPARARHGRAPASGRDRIHRHRSRPSCRWGRKVPAPSVRLNHRESAIGKS